MRFWSTLIMLFVWLNSNAQTNDAYSLGVEGIKAVDAGNYKEGIKLLKQARNLAPQEYDYTFEIGKAYFLSGNAKMAEKFLYPLQYHENAQPDLYLVLANCYKELEELKKNPNPERKKELDALRYGIQKFPQTGMLYLELGTRKIEMEAPIEALATLESGIVNAPNFADNYFWAAKLLNATGNNLWAWIYAETFFNLSEIEEMKRTAALLINDATQAVFSENWNAEPEKMDQDLRFMLTSKCASSEDNWTKILNKRACLMKEWRETDYPISAVIDRMIELESKGFLEPYLATIYLESDKKKFLPWLAEHPKEFDAFRKWRYWNPISLKEPVKRL